MEKDGVFGCFRQANIDERKAWEKFRDKGGPLPKGASLFDDDEREAA
jgi:hypothetical protein